MSFSVNVRSKIKSSHYQSQIVVDTSQVPDIRKAALKAKRLDEQRLKEEFKNDLFGYCDVANNPKAEQAFAMAWDRNRSDGLASVVDLFEELVDLIT